jgi:hypothetical protein
MDQTAMASPSTAHSDGPRLRGRLRELTLAWVLGAAVVIWPGDGSLSQAPWQTPPPFERALSWRELVRLKLSPWLVIQAMLSGELRADEFGADE